jgi:hypothetical protein
MLDDRCAPCCAFENVRRYELRIVLGLLEELLSEMPNRRGHSHQPQRGRSGVHRRGSPEGLSCMSMAKLPGLTHWFSTRR